MSKNDATGQPMEKTISYQKLFAIIWKNLRFMKGWRLAYGVGNILSMGNVLLAFLVPYLYQQLITLVTGGNGFDRVVQKMSLHFLGLVLLAPLVVLGSYMERVSANQARAAMEKNAFSHVLRLPLQKLEINRADKLMRATASPQGAANIFNYLIGRLLYAFVCFGGGGVALLSISRPFALIGVLLGAGMLALSTALNNRLRKLEWEATKNDTKAASHLLELVTNLPIVKTYLLEKTMTNRYSETLNSAYHKRLRYKTLRGGLDGGMDFLSYMAQSFIIGGW